MATDIIITATFDVDPKEIDDLMKRCKPLIEGALTEEGCQDYSWTLDPYVPGRIWVMERWESEDANLIHPPLKISSTGLAKYNQFCEGERDE